MIGDLSWRKTPIVVFIYTSFNFRRRTRTSTVARRGAWRSNAAFLRLASSSCSTNVDFRGWPSSLLMGPVYSFIAASRAGLHEGPPDAIHQVAAREGRCHHQGAASSRRGASCSILAAQCSLRPLSAVSTVLMRGDGVCQLKHRKKAQGCAKWIRLTEHTSLCKVSISSEETS